MEFKKAIEAYIERGFGSMNKNDFEVFIFNYIVNKHVSYKNKSNFELSILLRIPESKVKRLKYEANLKYRDFENNVSDLNCLLNKILSNAKLKSKGKQQIQFVIEDIYLRNYLDDYLKKNGRFSDSSFNSEIVIINLEDLSFLMENILNKDVSKLLKDAKKKTKIKLALIDLLQNIISKTTNNLLDLSINGLLLHINNNL